MSSQPTPKPSKRSRIRDSIRSSLGRVRQSIGATSSPDPLNQNSENQIAGGTTAYSPSPSTEFNSGRNPDEVPTTPIQVSSQGQGASGRSAEPPATPANVVPVAVNNAPEASLARTAAEKLKEAGSKAWAGLETSLQVLEKSADAFPPLKSAVAEFLACLDTVQAAAENREEYETITSELTIMVDTLRDSMGEFQSDHYSDVVAKITSSIDKEIERIKRRRDHSKAKRVLESTEDREDVIRSYRRIEALFRQLQNNISLRVLREMNRQREITLLRDILPEKNARYNSGYSTTVKRRGCTAETRVEVQADLQDWVRNPNAAKVYWMNGMAGTGKTTIAYSLCEWLESHKQLGASFFCSRALSSCRDVNRIIPTIAYQLACYSHVFRALLCDVLQFQPDANKLNTVWQFKNLVQEPMQEAKDSMPEGIVVVIDALDECESASEVRLIIEMLLRFGADLPLKFFVTSRPVPAVRDRMLSPGGYSPSRLHLHDIEQSIVEGDIKKYLTEALGFMSPPPSHDQIEQLAKRSGKLFIYAATVARYILPDNASVNSSARLKMVLAMNLQSTNSVGSNKTYKEIDNLYTTILAAAFNKEVLEDDEIEAIQLILRTAICAKEPMNSQTLASILELDEEQVLSALQPLRSVLHVSEDGGLVSTLHASFPDYMLDRSRSGEFYCDGAQHNLLLANRCFETMKEQLRFNICDLESSFVFDKDVPDLEKRIQEAVSPTLSYACQHWDEHLSNTGASGVLRDKLDEFLSCRLLFWMEVLNLMRCIRIGAVSLLRARKWLLANSTPEVAQKQATDAWNFVAGYAASACTHSTPHIYLSALPFCPKSSSVYANYWKYTRGLMNVEGTAMQGREHAALTTWLTDSEAKAIAFSPDDSLVAFGSGDCTVRVCDARTGAIVTGPFEGHTGPVTSLAFSPDGHHIVSGSSDDTIRVWDVHTGDLAAGPFEGHTGSIISVAFSPDGTRILSGSAAGTIQMRDACSGTTLTPPFEGHNEPITSFAISPTGAYFATGSSDCTIQVCDANTGDVIAGPLTGHTGPVTSLAFSHRGTYIASGSTDHTIQIWSVDTGKVISGPFEGHNQAVTSVALSADNTQVVSGSSDLTIRVWDRGKANTTLRARRGRLQRHLGWILSVALSPDGTRIATGSDVRDTTIRVWEAHLGDLVAGPLKGHTAGVRSLEFSPNNTLIVSGSYDSTVRVWDGSTGELVNGPFEGHTSSVLSVKFSPDGVHVVSGSDDSTVIVWNTQTGNAVAEPFRGHNGPVTSVAFSPDGRRIISGSGDCTTRVWDTQTGNLVVGPFEGHIASITSVAFSPDNIHVISASLDCAIRVWNTHTGAAVAYPLEAHDESVIFVMFSSDGSQIVSGSSNSTIRVWDIHNGAAVISSFQTDIKRVFSIASSTQGPLIVSSGKGFYKLKTHMLPTIRTSRIDQQIDLSSPLNGRWSFDRNGWITNNETPLFWTSPDLHDSLPFPQNTLAIGPAGSIRINYQQLSFGERWSGCCVSK